MPDTTENARRWNGYVCPDCRFVFRIPRDHDGKGVICPCCRRMLRVPGTGDVVPPLVENRGGGPLHGGAGSAVERAQEGERPAGEMVKRRRQPQLDEDPDWDTVPTERLVRVSKSRKSRKAGWIIAGVVGLALVTGLVLVVKRVRPDAPILAQSHVAPEPVREIKESEPEKIALPQEMARNQTELAAELEPLAKNFLSAATVEELLKYVRNPAEMEPKIRAWYPGGKVPAPGLSAFNTHGNVAFRGKLASVAVRTGDFDEKQLAFLRTESGMKVDWESYVGWSEMTWEQFLKEKPVKPVAFRVALKTLDYYNFSFSDEKKWRSYEIRSADKEHTVYGYVGRDTPLDEKIRPADANSTRLVVLKLKWEPGETSRNQLVIEDLLVDGWVADLGE